MQSESLNEVLVDEPVLWNGWYEKVFYRVHLPSGEIVKCWPNAGLMNSADGSGRSWKPEDRILVTVDDNDEFGSDMMENLRELAIEGLRKPVLQSALEAPVEDPDWDALSKAAFPPGMVVEWNDGVMRTYQSAYERHRAENKRRKRERYLKKRK